MSRGNASVRVVLALTSDTALLSFNGVPILIRAYETLALIFPSQKIRVVATPKHASTAKALLEARNANFELVIPETFEPKVLAQSLESLLGNVQAALIHDASRPLTSTEQFDAVLAIFSDETDAARPAMAFTETLKILDADSVIKRTLDRSSVLRVSTPELIRVSAIDFTGSDCGWFLPLKKNARIKHIEASPDSLRINSEDDRNLMELHTN
jgi:2-C-methyl-D-erythritol 4-phosphate cytidylyltransferase